MTDLSLKLVISGSNDGAIRALNQVVSSGKAAGAVFRQADESGTFSKTRKGLESISTQLSRVQTLAASGFTVNFLAGLVQNAIQAADEVKAVDARLKLASNSVSEYAKAWGGVRDIAFSAGTAVAANVALVARISDPVKAMGGSQQDVLALTREVNDSLRISNASTAEGSAAMLQFAQAMGAGVLQGEELNSVLENAPRLAKAIADGLGMTTGELKSLGAQGVLTSQQVFKALQSQQGALADEASRLPLTVGMAWTNAQEGVKQYIGQLDKSTGASTGLATALNTVATNIPAIASGLQDIATVAGGILGARMVNQVMEYVTTQRLRITADRLAAAEGVKLAETTLAVQAAVQRKAAADLAAIAVIDAYTLASNEAATADARRAAAARLAGANQAVVAASTALTTARAAEAAASVTAWGRAMTVVGTAGRGLLAAVGGPLGLVVTALTLGAMAWEHFAGQSKKATADSGQGLRDLVKQFNDFSGKMGPAQAEEALSGLRDAAAKTREQLASPLFRQTKEGQALAADLESAEKAISSFEKRLKTFTDNRTKERGLLGLDKLKLDTNSLIDADFQKSLAGFSTLYKDFTEKAIGDNGRLKASAIELKAALSTLFSQAKTSGEMTSLIEHIGIALKSSPKDANLKSQLENAIEARNQAELKALDSLVVGLEARSSRTQDLFSKTASVALSQFSQAAALAKVAAELNSSATGMSRIDVAGRNAELAIAQESANQQLAVAGQVAERKRELIDEQATLVKDAAKNEIDAANQISRDKINLWLGELAKGQITAAELEDRKSVLARETMQKITAASAARGQAEANAARQIREVDAEEAQQRAAIAQDLYSKLQAKSADALAAYKGYAQQVIALDKQIVSNRLDTAASINAIARKDMTPTQQADNLREELASIQAATRDALNAGQRDQALELLNRQKSMASELANVSGDGIDPKKMRQEAMATLADIGGQADAILQEQRDAAAAAAAEQLSQYQQMTAAMNTLASQIVALNEQASIKLRTEIDKSSLDGAIAAVQQAFQGMIIPIKVQAVGLPNTVAPEGQAQLPDVARAYGGPLPGSAPHDRADNMLYWGTPGEWVIQRPAVRYYGADWLAAINAMRLPKHAFGGQLGGNSVLSRLSIPSMPAAQGGASGTPVVLDMGFLGRYSVTASKDTQESLVKAVSSAARRFGKN